MIQMTYETSCVSTCIQLFAHVCIPAHHAYVSEAKTRALAAAAEDFMPALDDALDPPALTALSLIHI